MVNFGLNAAAILGLFLAVAGAGLFFLRSIRPELARDYDIFFAAVGLLCGIILLFNGWRLDPILQFGQFLLTGTTIFFAVESIRMRGVATEQARRNTPTVDRDRPVSRTRVYTEAELDKIDPYDNNVYEGAKPNYSSPRLRGYDDPQPRPSRRPTARTRPTPTADLRDEPPRRRPVRNRPDVSDYATRVPPSDRYGYEDPQRSSRRPPASSAADDYERWNDPAQTASRPRRPTREDSYSEPTATPEPIRRPGPADLGRSYEPEDNYDADDFGSGYDARNPGRSYDEPYNEPEESIPGDYVVDYQPVDNSAIDYDDSEANYDDYDNDEDYPVDDYPQPTSRKPINLGNDYD